MSKRRACALFCAILLTMNTIQTVADKLPMDKSAVSGAHELKLTNGQMLRGVISSSSKRSLTLRTHEGHNLTLPWSRVESCAPLENFTIREDSIAPSEPTQPEPEMSEAMREHQEALERIREREERRMTPIEQIQTRMRKGIQERQLQEDVREVFDRDELLRQKHEAQKREAAARRAATAASSPYGGVPSFGRKGDLMGVGQQASAPFDLDEGLHVFHSQHSGDGYFSIWLLNGSGEKEELLANTTDNLPQSKPVRIERSGSYLLDVDAEGRWSVTIERPAVAQSSEPSTPGEAWDRLLDDLGMNTSNPYADFSSAAEVSWPGERELSGLILFDGQKFLIANLDFEHWTNPVLEINFRSSGGGFLLPMDRAEARTIYTVGSSQLAKKDGTRFHTIAIKPDVYKLRAEGPDGIPRTAVGKFQPFRP